MENTFEEKLKRLEEIVNLIDENKLGLEESMAIYEEGKLLINELENTLKVASEKYQNILDGKDLIEKVLK